MNQRVCHFGIAVALALSVLQGCTDPKVEVPKLMRELQSRDSAVVAQAALALGRIGPPYANKAEADLIRLLRHENPGVRSGAAYALRKIDTPAAKAALDAAKHLK